MKRRKLDREVTPLGRSRIYRDDLEDIFRTLAELGKVSAVCDKYDVEDLADFAVLPSRLDSVRISSGLSNGLPKAEIELSPHIARMVVQEPTGVTNGVREKIRRIFEARGAFTSGLLPVLHLLTLGDPERWGGVESGAVIENIYHVERRKTYLQRTGKDWLFAAGFAVLCLTLGFLIGKL